MSGTIYAQIEKQGFPAVMEDATNTGPERFKEEEVRGIFGKFMEAQVLDRLLGRDNIDEIIKGQNRRVTCMFCDICGFTSLAEQTDPQELFALLNFYFHEVINVIVSHEGTIDKMIGDAIMVLFGAPLDQDDQEARSVRCAIEIQQKLATLRSENQHRAPLNMSITINTGQVSAGCQGNEHRMDYTVLGDSVNVAARMQDLAKADQILIGEETQRSLPDTTKTRPISPQSLRGKVNNHTFHEVIFN